MEFEIQRRAEKKTVETLESHPFLFRNEFTSQVCFQRLPNTKLNWLESRKQENAKCRLQTTLCKERERAWMKMEVS